MIKTYVKLPVLSNVKKNIKTIALALGLAKIFLHILNRVLIITK